jgi:Ran GTPase-activating protein (RanGAP) involved in mRNA processing and transport
LALSEFIEQTTTLKDLCLESNGITSEGMDSLSDALLVNSSVTALNLHENKLAKEGAEHVARVLFENKTLLSVDLGSNSLGDDGAVEIALALSNNCTMVSIDMSENDIGRRGNMAIENAIRTNNSIITHVSTENESNAFIDEVNEHVRGVQLKEVLERNALLRRVRQWSPVAKVADDDNDEEPVLNSIDWTGQRAGDDAAVMLGEAMCACESMQVMSKKKKPRKEEPEKEPNKEAANEGEVPVDATGSAADGAASVQRYLALDGASTGSAASVQRVKPIDASVAAGISTLRLNDNGIGPKGCRHLANVLALVIDTKEESKSKEQRHKHQVRVLTLEANAIGSKGALLIARGLRRKGGEGGEGRPDGVNTMLAALDLRDNAIGTDGCTEFLEQLYAPEKVHFMSSTMAASKSGKKIAKKGKSTPKAKAKGKAKRGSTSPVGKSQQQQQLLAPKLGLRMLDLGHNGIKGAEDGPTGEAGLNLPSPFMHLAPAFVSRSCKLKELRLEGNSIGPIGAASLAKALRLGVQGGCTIEVLMLQGNGIGDEGISMIARALQRGLNASSNGASHSLTMDHTSSGQIWNASVKQLGLQANGIGPAGAKAIARMLGANESLEELQLEYNSLGDSGAQELAKGFATAVPKPADDEDEDEDEDDDEGSSSDEDEEKSAAKAAKEAEEAARLADLMFAGRNTTLRRLNLWGNKIGLKGAKALLEVMVAQRETKAQKESDKKSKKGKKGKTDTHLGTAHLGSHSPVTTPRGGGGGGVEWLGLGNNNICENGKGDLAKVLKQEGGGAAASGTALRGIDLQFNALGDKGATQLGKALAKCPKSSALSKIHTLDLGSNLISAKGLVKLTNGVKAKNKYAFASLTDLSLRANRVCSAGNDGAQALSDVLKRSGAMDKLTRLDLREVAMGPNRYTDYTSTQHNTLPQHNTPPQHNTLTNILTNTFTAPS